MRCSFPVLLLLAVVASCGDAPAGHGWLMLGWTFADGRRCAESGVERVVLTRAGSYDTLAQADCPVGFATTALQVSLPAGEHELQLTGLSGAETPLYRRTFKVDLDPGVSQDRVLELAFIGGL